MFRRLFWLLVGTGFGFGASFWVMRLVRETVERYSPERVSAELAGSLRGLGTDLRLAAREGVAGMREYEANLRAQLEAPTSRRREE